jgi:hypothetical protein
VKNVLRTTRDRRQSSREGGGEDGLEEEAPAHYVSLLTWGWSLNQQGRNVEAVAVGESQLALALDAEVRIQALSLIADSHYNLGNQDQAIKRRRESIELIGTTSRTDPWAIEQMAGLEKWLRTWGRASEADDLKAEIKNLVGPADAGEDLATFNDDGPLLL